MKPTIVDVDLLDLFVEELRLCKVKPGELLVVLSAASEFESYVQTFLVAAGKLGANAYHMGVVRTTPTAAGVQGQHPLSDNRPAIEALKRADMVIDMLGLLFSKEQNEIQAAGTRILRVMEPPHILRQMFPTEDLRRRVERAQALLQNGHELHITSNAGTDVYYGLGQYTAMCEYGYTDEPGRWDHFPSGFAFTQPTDGKVNGVIVLAPGDILSAFKRYVESPVYLTIKDAMVTSIEGEGMDAMLIKNYMASFNDPRGYAISHIGWGLNERAKWHHMAATKHLAEEHVLNALSFYGNVLFSTGPNTEFGGNNDTKCHLDLPMLGCDLSVDGTQIIRSGDIVHPELRVVSGA